MPIRTQKDSAGQRLDARTGRPEIETHLAYPDPVPVARKPKPRLNHPMPWKNKVNAQRDSAKMYASLESAQQQQQQQRQATSGRDSAIAGAPPQRTRTQSAADIAEHLRQQIPVRPSGVVSSRQSLAERNNVADFDRLERGRAQMLVDGLVHDNQNLGPGAARYLKAPGFSPEFHRRGLDFESNICNPNPRFDNLGTVEVLQDFPAPFTKIPPQMRYEECTPLDEDFDRQRFSYHLNRCADKMPLRQGTHGSHRDPSYLERRGDEGLAPRRVAAPALPQHQPWEDLITHETKFSRIGANKSSAPVAAEVDILGQPKRFFSDNELRRMTADRKAMDNAVQEVRMRSEYDHFGKVMKRTTLVDEARRKAAEREQAMYRDAAAVPNPQSVAQQVNDERSGVAMRRAASSSQRSKNQSDGLDIFGNPTVASRYAARSQGPSSSSCSALRPGVSSEAAYHEANNAAATGGRQQHAGSSSNFGPLRVVGTGDVPRPLAQQQRHIADTLPDYITNPDPYSYVAPLKEAEWHEKGSTSGPSSLRQPPAGGGRLGGMSAYPRRDIAAFFLSRVSREMMTAADGWGVCRLRHILREYDKEKNGRVLRPYFKSALIKFGVELSEEDLNAVMRLAPMKASGDSFLDPTAPTIPNPKPPGIVIEDLLNALRRGETLPPALETLIRKGFHTICQRFQRGNDPHANGPSITFGDLQNATNYNAHSSYENCVRGAIRKVMMSFLAAWGPHMTQSSVVFEEDFVRFWADTRLSYSHDGDFAKMFRAMHNVT